MNFLKVKGKRKMAQRKQDTTTGNGVTKPILAEGNGRMAAVSKQFPVSTSIGAGSTKPVSMLEALSLLQTLCLDIRTMGAEVAILAKDKRVYVVIEVPASIGKMSMSNGHVLANGLPVSESVVKSIHNTAGLEPHIPK